MTTQRNDPQCWAGSSEKPGCVAPRLQAELSAAQSALAEKEREVERLTEERDSFQRVGIAAEARAGEAEKNYSELIMAVGNKWPNESRHETALRYIRRMEMGDSSVASAAKAAPPASPAGKE